MDIGNGIYIYLVCFVHGVYKYLVCFVHGVYIPGVFHGYRGDGMFAVANRPAVNLRMRSKYLYSTYTFAPKKEKGNNSGDRTLYCQL